MYKHLLFLLLLLPILLFSKTDSTLIISGDKNYAPYTYLDAKGEPKGMLVDMWREWAKVTDSKVKFEFNDWIESIEAVKNREADIHSGLYKKEPGLYKAENILSIKVSLFAKEGYTKKINKQRVGVIETFYGEELKKEYPNIKLVLYKNYDQIFKDMNDGKLELFYDTTESVLNASAQTDLDSLIELVLSMSKVVHSLQQERGASSGYIGSDGEKFKSKLNEIVQNSDAAKKELLINLNLNYELLKKYIKATERDSLNTLFNELFTLREDVKSLKNDFAKTYSKYTQIISYLLLNISEISDKVQNKQLMDELYIYSTLLMYKESIGQKRAALSTLFSQNDFSKEIFEYFLTSDTQEKIYLKNFLRNADKVTKEYYAKTLNKDVTKKVTQYERLALKKLNGEDVKVDPEQWFENVTEKINLIQEVEQNVFKSVLVIVDNIKRKDISSFVRISPYVIIPLKDDFFHPMSPATNDNKLIKKINDGFKKLSKIRLSEIENKWINEKNRYHSIFTLKEFTWIKKQKSIKVGVEQWNPVVFSNNGNDIDGIAGDYIKKIQKLTGLNIEVVTGLWTDLLADFKNKKIDLLPATYHTTERTDYGLYSDSYFKMKDYIYVKKNENNIKSLKDLNAKKLAIIKSYGTIPKIREKYPNIKLVLTKNLDDSLNMLLDGRVDAIYEAGIAVEKKINSEFIIDLKGFPETSFKTSSLHFFSQIDEPILHSILQKSLDAISKKEKNNINTKWFSESLKGKKNNEINIAFHFDRPPYMFGKTSSKGIEADLVKEILATQGYKLNIYQMAKQNMEKLLETNPDFDGVASVSDNDDKYFYSDKYSLYKDYAITRTADNITINSLDDLAKHSFVSWKNAYNDLGKTFYKYFNQTNGIYKSSYHDKTSQADQHKLFFNKKFDVVVVDKMIFQWYKLNFKNQEQYTFHNILPLASNSVVRFKNKKIRDIFNVGLANIRENGRYQEIIDFYLSEDIRPLLKFTNLAADISGKFIFSDKQEKLNKILANFFIHPDIMHIEVFDKTTKRNFISIYRDGKKIIIGEDKDKHHELPNIEKNIYFINKGNPLEVGTIKIYYKKEYKNKNGNLVPKLNSYTSLEDNDFKILKISYDKYGFNSKVIPLSDEEKRWLKEHPVIRFAGIPNWLPFETYNEQGKHIGIIAEYLDELQKSLNIKFERIVTRDYAESIALTKNSRVDMITDLIGPDEKTHLKYTQAYIHSPLVIVMNEENHYVANLNDIKDKKIAILRGYNYVQDKYRIYDDIKFEFVDSVQEGLMGVSTGKVDAYVCNSALGSYHISKMGLSNVKVVGKTEIIMDIGFGIRKDYEPLVSIINKALIAFGEEEEQQIFRKWIKQGYVEKVDYTLIWQILGIAFLLFLAFIYWNRKLSKVNDVIKEQQERFELTIAGSGDGLWEINHIKDSLWWSPQFKSLLGYRDDELQIKPEQWVEYVFQEDRASSFAVFSNHLESDAIYDTVFRMIRKNKDLVWVRARAKTLRDTSGNPLRTSGSVTDVTKLKDAEKEVKASQERFQTIFDAAPDSISIIKDGLYIDCNQATLDIYGFENREQILNTTPIDYSAEFQENGNPSEVEVGIKLQEAIDNGYSRFEWIAKYYDSDETFNAEVILSTIELEGEPHIYTVVRNINERKELENQILKNQEQFSSMASNVPGVIYRCKVDAEWTMLYISNEIETLVGYPVSDFINNEIRSFADIMYEEDIPPVAKLIQDQIDKDEKFLVDYRVVDKNGNVKWVRSQGQATKSEKGDSWLDGVLFDVTEQRALEQQIKENQEQMTFVSEHANFGFWTFNPQVGDLLVNDVFVKMLGYDANEVLISGYENKMFKPFKDGLAFWEQLLHPDDAERTSKVITAHINGETELYKIDYRMRRADGSWMWSTAIGRIQEYDNDGKPTKFNGVNIDIQESMEAKEEIQRSKLFLDTVLDSQEQIVITTDGTKLVTGNKAFYDFYDVKSVKEFIESYGNCICETFDENAKEGFLQSRMNNDEKWIDYIINNPHKIHKAIIIKDDISNIFTVTAAELPGDEVLKSAVFTNITTLEQIREKVESISKRTQDSIEYASLIQHALLPEKNLFNEYFQDFLTIWQPKDTVGGDIYLFEELRDKDECLLMVIDCTGHGVAGAFVTMLVKALERQIVAKINNDKDIEVSTAWILSYFNRTMKKLLQQETTDSISNAGFDGGIIYYNKKEKIIKYSGAETPLFYIDNGELNTIKGSRHSIGYKKSDVNFEFKEHAINVKDGMQFYLTTDGYLDQNGGEKDFPFGKKRFTALIEENQKISFVNQKKILLDTLKSYQGNEGRNDDVTLVGFKI